MDKQDSVAYPSNPTEFYSLVYQLSMDVKQATKEVRELTSMMRGDGLSTGLIIEHERIKNKIDYENGKSINDRLCEIERIIAVEKWVVVVIAGATILNILSFVGDVLARLQALPPH